MASQRNTFPVQFGYPILLWTGLAICSIISAFGFGVSQPADRFGPKLKLSEYQFFTGEIASLTPGQNVFEYEVNAPLFSDYAEKKRMIYLPDGSPIGWKAETAFDFPTGAIIIKNFFYWNDATHPENGRRILETRLLLKEETGWKALEYVWNAEQTEAFLEVAGESIPVSWVSASGKKMTVDYVIPNLNQCKGCHSQDGQFVPIGISARQLNRMENGENQLITWSKSGRLQLPPDFNIDSVSALFDYRTIQNPEKESAETLTQAARGYLDTNCAHCHNPLGPASTSGMFLGDEETNMERVGIGKPPVAAGRGSGNRKYGIVPGKPGESILVFRMEN